MRTLPIAFTLMLAPLASIAAEPLLLPVDTYLKASTAQASSLPAGQKCGLTAGTLLHAASLTTSGSHLRVTLSNEASGCGLTAGYLYAPHVARASQLLTVRRPTIFKARPLASNLLPASDKCDLPPGVYATTALSGVSDAHYRLTLRNPPTECGFASGYVFEEHATSGALAIQITRATLLKANTNDSSQLKPSDYCPLDVGLYPLAAPVTAAGTSHYRLTLATTPADCSNSNGYVYWDHTYLPQPAKPDDKPAPTTSWTFPMPDGGYSSAWCICRSIGTSPHIGQDVARYSGMKAVAVNSGTVIDTTFSSSCGYISYLRDDYGTLWRYVHLNKPVVGDGQRVKAGQLIANISAYPNSSCGTGPHLHFERRSAGFFKDAATGKSCQNGYRSCYYDPIKPWRAGYQPPQSAKASSVTAPQPISNWNPEVQPRSSVCKIEPSDYPLIEANRLNSFTPVEGGVLSARLSLRSSSGGRQLLQLEGGFKDNSSNSCSAGQCAVQWELLGEKADGSLVQLFFENGVRDTALKRVYDESYCALPEARRYWLLVKDLRGNGYRLPIQP